MENLEIAAVLDQVADLLEIKGANPFRVRAYRNAARTVREIPGSLRDRVAAGEELTGLSGIGKEMARHIRELLETNDLKVLEELARKVPISLLDLIRLDGVGPKKAQRLWRELDVTSVEGLEQAVREGRVAALEGFGEKSAERMTRAIESFRRIRGRILLSDADLTVGPFLEHVRGLPGVERVEVAGSYRRRRDTVGDLDIVVLTAGKTAVLEGILGFPGGSRRGAADETEGWLTLRSGLQVEVKLVSREEFGAALQYFTGSKDHISALRALGIRRGLQVTRDGASVLGPYRSEEEVYGALGLPWIPPLLREGRGEVEAAEEGRLPRLVQLADIRGDLQMHSTWSDGRNTLREMVEACRERGYAYLSITDHSKAVTVARGLTSKRVREQWEEIEEVRNAVDGIHLLRSLEVDILKDGSLDMPDSILEGLDLVLVSVHSFMGMGEAEMTERVIRAMEHPEVDILAHPTGRILNRREAFALDVDAVLEAARDLCVAVELNAHPSRLDLSDLHIRRAKESGVKVVINTDAHSVGDLAYMRYGVDQAGRGWLEGGDVLNALSLPELQGWIGRRDGT